LPFLRGEGSRAKTGEEGRLNPGKKKRKGRKEKKKTARSKGYILTYFHFYFDNAAGKGGKALRKGRGERGVKTPHSLCDFS